MMHGASHDCTKLPVAMPGGPIRGGRIVDFNGRPDRKLCSLYLSPMDRFGGKETSFGDTTKRLDNLLI
jgi:hypothetical protein